MGMFNRIKNIIRANTSDNSEYKKPDLFSLKPGDILNIEGDDYEVEGAMYMDDEGWKWIEYKLKEGHSTYWLSIEQDDELEIVLCKKVVHDISGTPKKLEYDGKRYYLDEASDAKVENTIGNISVPVGKWVNYWDYYDEEEEHAFFIEKWDGEIETSAGRYIEEYNVEIFPISER